MKRVVLVMMITVLAIGSTVNAADAFVFTSISDLLSVDGEAGDRIYATTVDGDGNIYYAMNLFSGCSVLKYDDSTGETSTLFSNISGDGWNNSYLNVYYGFGVSEDGSTLVWTDTSTDGVWTADTTTGAVTQVVSTYDVYDFTGVSGTGSHPTKSLSPFTLAPDGSFVFYEGESNTFLRADLNSGALSLVSDLSNSSYTGNNDKINSGLAYDSTGNLYFADSDTDNLYSMSSDGTFDTVISTSEILAISGESTAYINDIIVGEDGNIYFSEKYSGCIFVFNSEDGTLELLIDASLCAGVTAAREITWYTDDSGVDYVLFHDWESDVYAVEAVPEPMTMGLLALGGLLLRRKR